jgi:flagellar basal-body rod modification protein FlgD
MVTTTSTTNNQFGAASTNGATGRNAVRRPTPTSDMFTKLLVAQIRNQDPLAPQDPTAYVNQLSQLSQTEALQNLSQMTSASASVLQSLQTLAMGGQVGSEVTVATDTLKLDGARCSGSIQLNGASSATSLVLTGQMASSTRSNWAPTAAGSQSFTIDPDALGLAPGTYAIQAKPSDGTSPRSKSRHA